MRKITVTLLIAFMVMFAAEPEAATLAQASATAITG